MAGDAVPGSRQLLNLLCKGTGDVPGLNLRLQQSVGANPQTRVQPRYSYDESKQGLLVIGSPLEHPLVTLLVNNRQKMRFYRNDVHPNIEDQLAWGWTYNMQYDVWARTPVELAAIEDAFAACVFAMANPLWEAHRIGMELSSFADAPYEVDRSIYRSLASGTVTTAATVAVA